MAQKKPANQRAIWIVVHFTEIFIARFKCLSSDWAFHFLISAAWQINIVYENIKIAINNMFIPVLTRNKLPKIKNRILNNVLISDLLGLIAYAQVITTNTILVN